MKCDICRVELRYVEFTGSDGKEYVAIWCPECDRRWEKDVENMRTERVL